MAASIPALNVSLRRVLIATDLSECSQGAVRYGLGVARRYGSTVHFLHVVRPGWYHAAPPEFEEVARALPEQQAGELLADLRNQRALDGIEHRLWVLHGEVLEVVSQIVSRESIDLAVIGTHGRSGLRKLLIGSVAEQLFRNLPCPVLTVGPSSPVFSQDLALRHILLATDFSSASIAALPYAVSLAHDFSAQLTLLHVIENLHGEAAGDRARVFAALRKRLQDLAAPFAPLVSSCHAEVASGWPATAIVDFAHDHRADLVVLGLKPQQTFIDRLPWMHAYTVVCQANCPVLTLRGHSAP